MNVDTHEVDPETLGAHSHEHAHTVRSLSSKIAAHDHWHLHHEDPKADEKRNGHSHARRRPRMPWESHPVSMGASSLNEPSSAPRER